MSVAVPDVITSYLEVDESKTWRGITEIRAWRKGPASQYRYTTDVFNTISRVHIA